MPPRQLLLRAAPVLFGLAFGLTFLFPKTTRERRDLFFGRWGFLIVHNLNLAPNSENSIRCHEFTPVFLTRSVRRSDENEYDNRPHQHRSTSPSPSRHAGANLSRVSGCG